MANNAIYDKGDQLPVSLHFLCHLFVFAIKVYFIVKSHYVITGHYIHC